MPDPTNSTVVVVGYGPVVRTLSRILRDNGIQVVVVEMNVETVDELRSAGLGVVFGDAAQREILHHAYRKGDRLDHFNVKRGDSAGNPGREGIESEDSHFDPRQVSS